MLLHDHLDGGLRPATVIELAATQGHHLPTTDPDELTAWFRRGAASGDLGAYLATFRHTVGVMQTREALGRVARECAEDLAADGVVYAEVRFAPELHRERGLTLDDVLEAVTAGFAAVTGIVVRTIVTTMRGEGHALDAVRAAVAWRDRGVVAFDLAGAEAGHPASDDREAFLVARDGGIHVTIHAGEAAGPPSVADALDCGAERLGHGVRVIEDVSGDELGPTAARVRAAGVPLEVCPTSNVHTGAARSIAAHPVERLRRLGFTVTINTDNRLMSGVTASSELAASATAFGWDVATCRKLTVDAMRAAFCEASERDRLLADVIEPGWATGG